MMTGSCGNTPGLVPKTGCRHLDVAGGGAAAANSHPSMGGGRGAVATVTEDRPGPLPGGPRSTLTLGPTLEEAAWRFAFTAGADRVA